MSSRPPRPRKSPIQERQQRERIIIRASLRRDAPLIRRLQSLAPEMVVRRIMAQSLNEQGITSMEKRKRIMTWELKREFADIQMNRARNATLQDQFRKEAYVALNELRREFPSEADLHDFLSRCGELSTAYWAMKRKKK